MQRALPRPRNNESPQRDGCGVSARASNESGFRRFNPLSFLRGPHNGPTLTIKQSIFLDSLCQWPFGLPLSDRAACLTIPSCPESANPGWDAHRNERATARAGSCRLESTKNACRLTGRPLQASNSAETSQTFCVPPPMHWLPSSGIQSPRPPSPLRIRARPLPSAVRGRRAANGSPCARGFCRPSVKTLMLRRLVPCR